MWSGGMAEWSHDHTAMASSSELLGVKRHRRPSVRLGEIGDLPAAIMSESSFKRKKVNAGSPPTPANQADNAAHNATHLGGNGPLDVNAKGFKHGKAQVLADPNHDDYLREDVYGQGAQHHASCSHSAKGGESPLAAYANTGRKAQHLARAANKKVRNWNRKPGGIKGTNAGDVGKKPSFDKQIDSYGKGNIIMNDDADGQADTLPDANLPEGYRDSDLETTEYSKDAKEISNSLEAGSPHPYTVRSPLDHQQDYQSSHSAPGNALEQEEELVERSQDKGGAANNQVDGRVDGREVLEHSSGVDVKLVAAEVNAKLAEEANGNVEDREYTSENAGQQFGRRPALHQVHSFLVSGVRGWLQGLGLGKYATLFDTHEVDAEVLPLLTLDDLKDMGISAVGSRRKLFYAIQQLRKGLFNSFERV